MGFRIKIFTLLILLFSSSYSFSQDKGPDLAKLSDKTAQDFMMVGGMGVAGAVLGLSTLSFVEKPMEHLKNITIGASIGIILGVAMVAYNQATSSRDNLSLSPSRGNDAERITLNQLRDYFPKVGSKDFYDTYHKESTPLFYLSHNFSF